MTETKVVSYESRVDLKALQEQLAKSWLHVRNERSKLILRVQHTIMKAVREYLDTHGFVELLPPIIGPVTDPGIRGAGQVTIDFYGQSYKVMSSAILYKQMMATSLGKVYFFSPNVRIEAPETALTGRHLAEFVQVDLEMAHADYREAMQVAEDVLADVIRNVTQENHEDLQEIGRRLDIPTKPFTRLSHAEVVELLGSKGHTIDSGKEVPWNEESFLSNSFKTPFFIYDYPVGSRGFYDKQDNDRPQILRDFDLMYPEGFGEAASGAEREHEYGAVVERIHNGGEDPSKYGWYLDMLKEGIEPSAGFGIGVERLTRYVCGLGAVWEARPYPKVAEIFSP
jgi:asparaginyl-tRNA synthetase